MSRADVMSSEKIGRNDPCPCGSGRKYKRCCLGKEESDDPEVDQQARKMIAFIQPLLPKRDLTPADVETAMSLGAVCWRLALSETEALREERLVEALDAFKAAAAQDVPDDAIVAFREMAKMMVERHREMFPEMHPRPLVMRA